MLWYHYVFGAVLIVFSIVITIVVLMQEGKQQGLGGAISGAADSYWGKNKGRSMEGGLVKATTIMAVLFFVLAAVLNMNF
jgi:preprotein translocase subunit SecG